MKRHFYVHGFYAAMQKVPDTKKEAAYYVADRIRSDEYPNWPPASQKCWDHETNHDTQSSDAWVDPHTTDPDFEL